MNEIIEKRGRKSKTFDLGGGKYRLELGNHSHTSKSGLWLPTDTSVEAETGVDADVSMNYIARSRFENLDYDIRFGKNDPVWMKIKHIPTNKTVVFKPRNNNNKPDHVITGNKIFVSQAWDGIDMEIFVTDRGTKTNYLITSAAGQRVVEFNVSGDVSAFAVEAPWYSNPGERNRVAIPTGFSAGNLSYDFRGVPIGTKIDPTVTIQPDGTGSADSFMDSNNPTYTGYYNADYLYLGDIGGAQNVATRTILKLTLPDLSGYTVDAATLRLVCSDSDSNILPNTAEIFVHRCLKAFVENQVTWNNAATGTAWGTAGAESDGEDYVAAATDSVIKTRPDLSAYDWDVTSDVSAFVAGTATNHGWIVKSPDIEYKGASYNYWAFRSGEYTVAADRPSLIVDYSEAGVDAAPASRFGAGQQYPFARGKFWR